MKKLILTGVGMMALVVVPAVAAHAENAAAWIHVRVEEPEKQSKVSVNLPLSVVEVALEAAPEIIESHGNLHLGEDAHVKIETMRKIWKELQAVGDAELVSVQSEEENVSVRRRGDLVQVFVDSKGKEGEAGEEVRVEIPVALVDAILSGEGEEINLKAALAELQNQRGNIVTVREKDTSVRVWIDETNVATE
jgi:phosphoribosylanthranilate isomerase